MNYYRFRRTEMKGFLPKGYNKVLEVGCGEGLFRKTLNADCECWGIECVASAAEKASSLFDTLLLGSYDEVCHSLPMNYFDLVICNDVIEHMCDEHAFFNSARTLLTQHGCVVGSVPNVRHIKNIFNLLIKKDWQYTEAGLLDNSHLRFFTRKSISRTLITCGYAIEELKGINSIASSRKQWSNVLKKVVFLPPAMLLGFDTLYLQFGFRVRKL